MNITVTDPESSCKYFLYRTVGSADQVAVEAGFKVELETKAIRKFAKISYIHNRITNLRMGLVKALVEGV